jgi:hypothetical protein
MQVPTANDVRTFITDFILDAGRRCFKYAVEKEYHKIPVWSGAAQASTQAGNDIAFGISPKANYSGIDFGKSKGSYELSISGDELQMSFNSGLKYFEFLDESAGRSPTSPWKFKDTMWGQFNDRFNFIVENEYEQKFTNFLGV